MAKIATNFTGTIPETGDSFESATLNTTGSLEGIDTKLGTIDDNITNIDDEIGTINTSLSGHISNISNPHSVTKSQIGLGNVDNTSDLIKMTASTFSDLDTTDKTIVGAINEIKTTVNEVNERTGTIRTFDTITDAQAYDGFVDGDIIEVLGYYEKGDGLGSSYILESYDKGNNIQIGQLYLNDFDTGVAKKYLSDKNLLQISNKSNNISAITKDINNLDNINIDFKNPNDVEWHSKLNMASDFENYKPLSSNSYCLHALQEDVATICIEAELYYSGINDNNLIILSTNTKGVYSPVGDTFGFDRTGFFAGINGNSRIVLISNSELSIGWYVVKINKVTQNIIVYSVHKKDTTLAKTGVLETGVTSKIKNIILFQYASSDIKRNVKLSYNKTSTANFMVNKSERFKNHFFYETGVHNVSTGLNSQGTICIPSSYNHYTKNEFVIFFHGNGGNSKDYFTYTNENSILKPLLDCGFIVMSITGNPSSSWGAESSYGDALALINAWKEYFSLSDNPFVIGQSMGGIVGLNFIKNIKCKAFVGIYPACNLRWCFDNGFKSDIKLAYNFTLDSEYESKTLGYDPLLNDIKIFKCNDFLLFHSYEDTVVSRTYNSDLLKAKVGKNINIITTTGNHGDSSNFKPNDIKNFFLSKL